jgi:hypothetical protein
VVAPTIGAGPSWTAWMISALSIPQVGRGDPKVGMPQSPLDDDQRDRFAGHLDGVSVAELVRRESPPDGRPPPPRFASACGSRRESRGGQRWVREAHRTAHRPAAWRRRRATIQLLPGPAVHPDLVALASLATAHQHHAACSVEIALLKGERLADPQSGAPQHDDHTAQP